MFFFKKRLKKSDSESEERFAKAMKDNKVGFKDGFAMIISAFLVIVLPCLLILLALAGIFILILM